MIMIRVFVLRESCNAGRAQPGCERASERVSDIVIMVARVIFQYWPNATGCSFLGPNC